jgi:peptidylprolyl isomerase
VANSRRRERELARRRYERRRLREQQERARRRRRNTVIGAGVGTAAVLAGIIILIVSWTGGSSGKPNAQSSSSSSSTPSPTPTIPPAAPTRCAPVHPNPPAKGQPHIPDVVGKAPTRLVVKDVKKGTGRAAKAGDSLSVTYIGVACSTGEVFDATYKDGGQPFTVAPLGKASVIAGWNKGLIGVRAGGVRELVIPASLGYGASGAGSTIKPNETLIFLITVKSVKK